MISKAFLKRIDQKLQLIQAKRPLSAQLVKKLKEQFSFDLTYNSNAIEGNKLTLKETYLVINDGMTVKGKSLKDHLEAKNHNEAVHFLYKLVEHDKKHPISEQLIRSLQHLIIKEIEDSDAGRYRQGNVLITGSSHKPPDAFKIPKLMEDLTAWIKKSTGKLHPVQLAALAHHKLVNIHPFTDGNGRTARLFMNLILMQKGYPMVVILKNDRQKYYRALEKADKGSTDDIEKFIAQAVERSMNIYLKAIESTSNKNDQLVPLSTLSKHGSFSSKYLNLLVRSGKLEAHKEGRIWLSSKKALDEYLENRERKRTKTEKKRSRAKTAKF
jgi:Fic family protein